MSYINFEKVFVKLLALAGQPSPGLSVTKVILWGWYVGLKILFVAK
jgi:hypothetical protein